MNWQTQHMKCLVVQEFGGPGIEPAGTSAVRGKYSYHLTTLASQVSFQFSNSPKGFSTSWSPFPEHIYFKNPHLTCCGTTNHRDFDPIVFLIPTVDTDSLLYHSQRLLRNYLQSVHLPPIHLYSFWFLVREMWPLFPQSHMVQCGQTRLSQYYSSGQSHAL